MRTLLKVRPALFDDVVTHLLRPGEETEQAAFLFASLSRTAEQVLLDVFEARKLEEGDFAAQQEDYLELTDAARAGLIKRAHELRACLVEVHSHLGDWPAAFSIADRRGLKETVPHMHWRLDGRPYLAIVLARSGFDALLWVDNPRVPRALDAVVVGDRFLKPTNYSLKGWR